MRGSIPFFIPAGVYPRPRSGAGMTLFIVFQNLLQQTGYFPPGGCKPEDQKKKRKPRIGTRSTIDPTADKKTDKRANKQNYWNYCKYA